MREIPIYTKNFGDKFKEGLESVLYFYSDPTYYDDEVLYKRFRSVNYIQDFNQDVKDDMLENKKDKILMIPDLNCFKDEVKILDLGIERGKIQGYTEKKSLFVRFRIFCHGVKSEFKKVHWTSKDDMVKYSIATIFFIIFCSLFFYVVDVVFAFVQSLF